MLSMVFGLLDDAEPEDLYDDPNGESGEGFIKFLLYEMSNRYVSILKAHSHSHSHLHLHSY